MRTVPRFDDSEDGGLIAGSLSALALYALLGLLWFGGRALLRALGVL